MHFLLSVNYRSGSEGTGAVKLKLSTENYCASAIAPAVFLAKSPIDNL